MIISSIDEALFTHIVRILKRYGVEASVKFILDEDPIQEYNQFAPERTNQEGNSLQEEFSGDYLPKSLILYTRGNAKKSERIFNNRPIFQVTKEIDGSLISRSAFFGEIDYNITILTDNSTVIDIIESLYSIEFHRRNSIIYIDYLLNPGDTSKDAVLYADQVPYRTVFDSMSGFQKLVQASNVFKIEFSVKVEGLIFLSFNQEYSKKVPVKLLLGVGGKSEDTTYEIILEKDLGSVYDTPDDRFWVENMNKNN